MEGPPNAHLTYEPRVKVWIHSRLQLHAKLASFFSWPWH